MISKRNEGVTTLKGLNTPSTSPEVERGIGGRKVNRFEEINKKPFFYFIAFW
jgi:hypothetical protein